MVVPGNHEYECYDDRCPRSASIPFLDKYENYCQISAILAQVMRPASKCLIQRTTVTTHSV